MKLYLEKLVVKAIIIAKTINQGVSGALCRRRNLNMDRRVVHTRHVLAVKDLDVETAYYIDKLGFERDFTAPGWEFLSFGMFKVMLGECADEMTAEATGNHSWYAHALIENVDQVYQEFIDRGATILSPIASKPWNIREFSVVTPDGHRIVFGQLINNAI